MIPAVIVRLLVDSISAILCNVPNSVGKLVSSRQVEEIGRNCVIDMRGTILRELADI